MVSELVVTFLETFGTSGKAERCHDSKIGGYGKKIEDRGNTKSAPKFGLFRINPYFCSEIVILEDTNMCTVTVDIIDS